MGSGENGKFILLKDFLQGDDPMHILIINVADMLAGTAIGCLLKKYVPKTLQENSMIYFAVITAVLGIRLINRTTSLSAVVIAFLLGGIVGHFLKLDQRIKALPSKFSSDREGLDTSTLMVGFTLFCISTSGILGAMDLGFSGDSTMLITKAIMDFLAAIFLAAGCGWSLALIAIPLGIILGVFYFSSGLLMPHLTAEMIGDFSSCGGMILMLNALRIAKIKNPPVTDLIPALVFIFPISWFWMTYVQL